MRIKPWNMISPRLAVFSEGKPTSEEFSEGMLWMEDRGMSVSVLVSQVDSVSLVQLSIYLGSNTSVLEPPQPMTPKTNPHLHSLGLEVHYNTSRIANEKWMFVTKQCHLLFMVCHITIIWCKISLPVIRCQSNRILWKKNNILILEGIEHLLNVGISS